MEMCSPFIQFSEKNNGLALPSLPTLENPGSTTRPSLLTIHTLCWPTTLFHHQFRTGPLSLTLDNAPVSRLLLGHHPLHPHQPQVHLTGHPRNIVALSMSRGKTVEIPLNFKFLTSTHICLSISLFILFIQILNSKCLFYMMIIWFQNNPRKRSCSPLGFQIPVP